MGYYRFSKKLASSSDVTRRGAEKRGLFPGANAEYGLWDNLS